MQVLLGCLTRSVSSVTACMTRGKKGRGEKSGKREKRRSSFSLHSGREKRGKGFSYLPTPPFSLPHLHFSTPATQATGYGHGTKKRLGRETSWKPVRIAHRKSFAGKSEMGSQWIFTYIFNYTKRWQINWPPFVCQSLDRSAMRGTYVVVYV